MADKPTIYGTTPTDMVYQYYGDMADGGKGWSYNLEDFKPGGIQGAAEFDQKMLQETAKTLGYDPTSWAGQNFGMSNMDLLKGGLGVGQLGLGIMGYLDQKKTAELQRRLMDQQIDQNKFLINQAKQRQADIAGAFGPSQGLAANVSATAVPPGSRNPKAPSNVDPYAKSLIKM